jgi:hypothetical protein
MTRDYTVQICDPCILLEGAQCHDPECIFCRRTMTEVGKLLDVLLIRPIVDGKRLNLTDVNPVCVECRGVGFVTVTEGGLEDAHLGGEPCPKCTPPTEESEVKPCTRPHPCTVERWSNGEFQGICGEERPCAKHGEPSHV